MNHWIIPLHAAAAIDPERTGPKAANLARLAQAGLPTPGGFCIAADAYRRQIQHLGIADAVGSYPNADPAAQRKLSVEIRLALYQSDLAPDLLAAILGAWWEQPKPAAVRSSALIEDRADSNFAGQFESFLGMREDAEFLIALRACWAALWTTNARRGMAQHGLNPADTAMAVLVQPLVAARASGGGLSETADGHMVFSRDLGARLGDRARRSGARPHRAGRQGFVRTNEAGRKHHRETCLHGAGTAAQAVPEELQRAPCLEAGQATTLGRLMRKAEKLLGHAGRDRMGVGRRRLQAVAVATATCAAAVRAGRNLAQASGAERPSGRYRLGLRPRGRGQLRMRTLARCAGRYSGHSSRRAGAVSHILPRVAGVVAELGGSTSHLASLARERGIPMVLGVNDATLRIPDGAQVAVDGVAGVVRWVA